MRPLFTLACAVLCLSAQAQPPPTTPPPVIVDVFSDGGTPTFTVEGIMGSNGPILNAGGTLVVRANDGLIALVVVEPGINRGEAGTVGQNATMAFTGFPSALQAPPQPDEAEFPTYHPVSVLVCTDVIPDEMDGMPPTCGAWRALRPAGSPDGPLGFTLEVNYGIGVLAPAPAPDPPTGEPDDPE